MRVEIGDESWEGVHYVQVHEYEAGMMGCTHGNKKPGEIYTQEKILCLGERPRVNCKPSKRPDHCCYNLDGADWYLAGYCSKDTMRVDNESNRQHNAKYNPFGPHFLIMPWEPGLKPNCSKIDDYEWKWPRNRKPWSVMIHDPYIRYPLTITNL